MKETARVLEGYEQLGASGREKIYAKVKFKGSVRALVEKDL